MNNNLKGFAYGIATCIQRKNIMDYALGDRARYLWSSPSIH